VVRLTEGSILRQGNLCSARLTYCGGALKDSRSIKMEGCPSGLFARAQEIRLITRKHRRFHFAFNILHSEYFGKILAYSFKSTPRPLLIFNSGPKKALLLPDIRSNLHRISIFVWFRCHLRSQTSLPLILDTLGLHSHPLAS
jgi:hypothetical protein